MVAVWLIKVVADKKVESWSSEMVLAVFLIKGVADENVVSWSSEVVVGVFEELFCRQQSMVVEVDVFKGVGDLRFAGLREKVSTGN